MLCAAKRMRLSLQTEAFREGTKSLASSITNRPRSGRLPGAGFFLIQENKVIASWLRKCRCASSCCNPIKLMTEIRVRDVGRSSPNNTVGVESGSRGTQEWIGRDGCCQSVAHLLCQLRRFVYP